VRLLRVRTSEPREREPCRCGHVARAHEHYRRGSDCALCECRRYRGAAPRPFVDGGPHERPRERPRAVA
jgi:hypothetical protein